MIRKQSFIHRTQEYVTQRVVSQFPNKLGCNSGYCLLKLIFNSVCSAGGYFSFRSSSSQFLNSSLHWNCFGPSHLRIEAFLKNPKSYPTIHAITISASSPFFQMGTFYTFMNSYWRVLHNFTRSQSVVRSSDEIFVAFLGEFSWLKKVAPFFCGILSTLFPPILEKKLSLLNSKLDQVLKKYGAMKISVERWARYFWPSQVWVKCEKEN